MNAEYIVARLVEIDQIFEENKNNENFYKTDYANDLRSYWLYFYNKLASLKTKN